MKNENINLCLFFILVIIVCWFVVWVGDYTGSVDSAKTDITEIRDNRKDVDDRVNSIENDISTIRKGFEFVKERHGRIESGIIELKETNGQFAELLRSIETGKPSP
jgi:peptidoglycan hydrolase CwlO-like protein